MNIIKSIAILTYKNSDTDKTDKEIKNLVQHLKDGHYAFKIVKCGCVIFNITHSAVNALTKENFQATYFDLSTNEDGAGDYKNKVEFEIEDYANKVVNRITSLYRINPTATLKRLNESMNIDNFASWMDRGFLYGNEGMEL